MPRLKILFADDQILPEDVASQSSQDWIRTNFPEDQWPPNFINAFSETSKTIKRLQRDGHKVILARTLSEAETCINSHTFDIAIIDLGWGTDSAIPEKERGYAGWKLSEMIFALDAKRPTTTRQIMYSIKFLRDPELSRIAAGKGILPVFKSEGSGEEGRESLMAAVSFTGTIMNSQVPTRSIAVNVIKTYQDLMNEMLKEPLRQYKSWFNATIVFVSISISTLIAGVIIVILSDNYRLTIISSLSNVLTNTVTALFLRQLHKARSTVEKCRSEIRKEIKRYF